MIKGPSQREVGFYVDLSTDLKYSWKIFIIEIRRAKLNQKDLAFLKELLAAGKIVPVIDRRYALSETAEAIRYLGEGHAKGKVVITMENNNKI